MGSRIFTYSSNNPYAYEYYTACRKFDDIKYKLNNAKNLTPEKSEKLEKEFEYWDKQVPLLSNKAGAEEEKIKAKVNLQKDNSIQGNKLDFMA